MQRVLMIGGMLCVLLAAQTGLAQEWTRFRGPNGTGVSDVKTVPVSWTEKDVRFKVELPAEGHSSPVLWGDRVFLSGADDGKSAKRQLFCLHALTGKLLWVKEFASQFHKKHQLSSFAAATPACDAERVYYSWSTPDEYTLIALTHDGDEVWRRNLGPYVSQHSCGVSPVVYKNLVVLVNVQDGAGVGQNENPGTSSIIAVDKATGKTVWDIPQTSTVVPYSTPCVRELAGGLEELIINGPAKGMLALDPLTGKVNWEVPDLLDKRSVSSPVILQNGLITISCGSGGGGNYLLAVHPTDDGTASAGKSAYKVDKMAPYVPTPIAVGTRLFLWTDNGIVMSIDANTGEKLKQKRVGGTYYSSPICVDGKLYAANTAGEMLVVSADDELETLATNPLGEFSHSTAAVAHGRMYIRTYKHLISLGGEAERADASK